MENRREWLKKTVSLATGLTVGEIAHLTKSAGTATAISGGITSSYTVFIDPADGNLVKAHNSATGAIDYSSPDAATVIQNALDALASTGGLVQLKAGVYSLLTALSWKNTTNLTLCGEGSEATSLDFAGTGGTSILDFDRGQYGAPANRVTLSDFQLTNSQHTWAPNTILVNLNHVVRASLKRIKLDAPNGSSQTTYGFYTQGQGNNSLVLEDCLTMGIDIGYEIWQDHVLLNRCQAAYGRIGFRFRVAGLEIAGVDLTAYNQNSGGTGFFIDYDYNGQLSLISPYSENPSGYAQYDYDINAGVGTVVLINPQASRKPPILNLRNATNLYAIGNQYWSGRGSATFSGNGSTKTYNIAHGLATTPRTVFLSAKSSDAAADIYWTANSKNIAVNFNAAPRTGTNNIVIGWRADV